MLAFVFLRSADEAGKQLADSETHAVSQIDKAHDAAAQGTMGRATVVALGPMPNGAASPPISPPSPPTTRASDSPPVLRGSDDRLVRGERRKLRRRGSLRVGHMLVGQDRRGQRHEVRNRDPLHGIRRHGGLGRVLVGLHLLSPTMQAADKARMDDSFSFRTTVPLRRQFDPLKVKAAVFGTMVALGVGLFANWVISSERESFSRADRRVVPTEVQAAQVDSR